MRRLPILSAILFSLILIAIPAANACSNSQGCRHTIKVIPIGSTETGNPIVTQNPANLTIFHTGNGPIKNVWLLIVINQPTYKALNKIIINDADFMTQDDFQLIETKKIPPALPNSTTGYPGSLCQYEVSAIEDKIKEKGNPIYYGVKFFKAEITKTPTNFKLTVELNSNANLKALVLALGRYDCTSECGCGINCGSYKPFNACSSFSKSTFVIPEASTLALTLAPLCSVASLYVIQRRKKLK